MLAVAAVAMMLMDVNQRELAGSCIGRFAGYSHCEFSLSVHDGTVAGTVSLHSQKTVGKQGKHALFKDLDTVTFAFDPKQRVLNVSTCSSRGVGDDTIVALTLPYGSKDAEMIAAVDHAYRIELPSGRIIAIDPHDVRCGNTAIGAD